jgi:3-deoxy-D-manno-octulosonic-acid transferase
MPELLTFYKRLTHYSGPLLTKILNARLKRGKEDGTRLNERMGRPQKPRPAGALLWIHAASVGEAQSALILIEAVGKNYPGASVMVTTGTINSATVMAKRLPAHAFHQFVPLDHPDWIASFLDHWKPDAAFWMESELWPNALMALKSRNIPTALINARMSDRSFARWKFIRGFANEVLSCFTCILTQTDKDAQRFKELGADNIFVTDNLKYSSAPLPFDEMQLAKLKNAVNDRPIWVYGSSHAGEESLSARVHARLKTTFPNLLTIIVPRHPDRRASILQLCTDAGLTAHLRGNDHVLPTPQDDIYIADTMGELGLFYTLAPVAIIGRSFSDDGGGGHNPVEAAQLNCAVLTGPNVQNQTEMFDDMFAANAAKQVHTEEELYQTLKTLFSDPVALNNLQRSAMEFATRKSQVIQNVLGNLAPLLQKLEKSHAA